MTRTAMLFGVIAIAFAAMLHAAPAQAQRVFVSGSGADTNPCTFPAPCRTFQQAFNTVAAGGEIDVLDPAGYGPLTITHAISIQAHGFGGITYTSTFEAISIQAGAADAVTLNGLLIDGAGAGTNGIVVFSAGSVQILNCVVRNFLGVAIAYQPSNTPVNLLISDTTVSDSTFGIEIFPGNSAFNTPVTLRRIAANHNFVAGVLVEAPAYVMVANSVISNNATGLGDDGGSIWLTKSVISGNTTGVAISSGVVDSYGDNDINSNTTNVSGSLGSTAKR